MRLLYIFTCLLTSCFYGVFTLTPERNNTTEYWTSCTEFLNNTKFDPDRIIGIDWMIFYFWNPEIEQTYNVKFSRPTEMLVDRFKSEIDADVRDKINWTNAELFMEASIDFSALFLKTNVSGVYRILPSKILNMLNQMPTFIFAMKIIQPYNILGIENCQFRLCYALAPVDKLPHHTELETAARSLGFFGNFNRSHIDIPGPQPGLPPMAPMDDHQNADDMQEDEDLDIGSDPDALQFF